MQYISLKKSYLIYTNSQIKYIKYLQNTNFHLPVQLNLPHSYVFFPLNVKHSLLLKASNAFNPIIFYNEIFYNLKRKDLMRRIVSLSFSHYLIERMRLFVESTVIVEKKENSCIDDIMKKIDFEDLLIKKKELYRNRKRRNSKKQIFNEKKSCQKIFVENKALMIDEIMPDSSLNFAERNDDSFESDKKTLSNQKNFFFDKETLDKISQTHRHCNYELGPDEENEIQKKIYERIYEMENVNLKKKRIDKNENLLDDNSSCFLIKNNTALLSYFENKIYRLLKYKFDISLVLLFNEIVLLACKNEHVVTKNCKLKINEKLSFLLEDDYLMKLNLFDLIELEKIFLNNEKIEEKIVNMKLNKIDTITYYLKNRKISVLLYYAERKYDEDIYEFLIKKNLMNEITTEIYEENIKDENSIVSFKDDIFLTKLKKTAYLVMHEIKNIRVKQEKNKYKKENISEIQIINELKNE
ncbi:hypothetical protein GVAV_000654 [Gurleya vavrai]